MPQNRPARPLGIGIAIAQPCPPQNPTKKTVRLFKARPKTMLNQPTPPHTHPIAEAPQPPPTHTYPPSGYATYARKPKKSVKTHQGLTKALFCVSRGRLKWVCQLRKILSPNLKKFINDLHNTISHKSLNNRVMSVIET